MMTIIAPKPFRLSSENLFGKRFLISPFFFEIRFNILNRLRPKNIFDQIFLDSSIFTNFGQKLTES